jgi:hypothetical protein
MAFLIGGANSDSGAYQIDNSLRYDDGDSARLSHTTGSSGSARTFTWSMWLKRSTLSSTQYFFNSNNGHSDAAFLGGLFNSSDELLITSWDGGTELKTNALFRDPAAWYHLVFAIDTTQSTNTNRVKLYINGTQETSFDTASYPDQNHDFTGVGDSGVEFIVGAMENSSPAYANFYDGYISEFNFVDGAQKAASDFGETNDNGVWIPKKYTGSYGTNGYFLEFQQTGTGTASASTIGADTSGNTNHFTSTSLAATDVTTDTPTNNFSTIKIARPPASSGAVLSEGNTHIVTGSTGGGRNMGRTAYGTMPVNKGKWYYEVKLGHANLFVGVAAEESARIQADTSNSRYTYYYGATGEIYINTSGSETDPAYGPSSSVNDVLGFAMDADNMRMYVRGSGGWSDGSGNFDEANINDYESISFSGASTDLEGYVVPACSSSAGGTSMSGTFNFGNPAFTISSGNADANGYGNFEYAVPSGYYSLCTKNLAEYG